MRIDTYDAVVGRLLDDPVLETSRTAATRFVVGVALEARVPTGELARAGGPVTHTLVATGLNAQRAFEQFMEGDYFIAVGTARLASCGRGPACVPGLVFEAWHLGHELTRSRYAVDRTRRRGLGGGNVPRQRREAVERELAIVSDALVRPDRRS